DPDVIRLATDPFYFTYLWRAHKRGVQIDIVPGDGRLSLEQEKDKFFRTIVLDAYSSDAIPTHLITKEAIMLYMRKLKDDGILAVHVSNRYFDLREVLVYEADELHLNCLWKYKESTNKVASVWVILTRDAKLTEAFKKLNFQQVWGRADANHRLWTDDYSSPLSVMHTDMW
ncbi:MAG: fused MFS/spermidine synthase, partial [Cyanobacteria bacterium]|nr:fused MFS/spermidine synthase [Cyanobacteriota bacterium]